MRSIEEHSNCKVTKIGSLYACTNVNTIPHHRKLDFKVIVDLIYPYMYYYTSIRICDLQ